MPVTPFHLEGQMKVMKIVWLALMASVFMLGFVLSSSAGPATEVSAEVANPFLLPILIATAVAVGLLSFVLPPWLMKSSWRNPALTEPIQQAYSKYFVSWLAGQALRESIATLGFVAAMTSHNKDVFFYMATASLVLQFLGRPQITKVRELEQALRMKAAGSP